MQDRLMSLIHDDFRSILAVFTSALVLFGCLQKPPRSQTLQNSKPFQHLDRCVALRGNGTHAVAHLMSLARITAQWGEVQGFAGGSSATITTFLYESILLNAALPQSKGQKRDEAIAFLLKSIVGYMSETMDAREWSALKIIGVIAAKINETGALAWPASEYVKAGEALAAALSSEKMRGLINPDVLAMLANAPNPHFKNYETRVEEVRRSAAALTNLDASDPDVFFRPGLLEFSYVMDLIGHVADFYAGIGVDAERLARVLDGCAPGTGGQIWSEIAAKKLDGIADTCGERFRGLVRDWRAANRHLGSKRMLQPPGLAVPNIMVTSVIMDQPTLQKFESYEKSYHRGVSRSLDVKFENVKFGYWISAGFPEDVIERWNRTNPDGKSRKAVSLGSPRTWREILEKSPREPSLGKYMAFSGRETASGSVSLGGWSDLHPVQVLKAAGCSKVIYVTRRTAETTFISAGKPFANRKPSGLAELLGMTPADYDTIYDIESNRSAFVNALAQADGIWCTDWNRFSAMEQEGIALDAWRSPLITEDSELSKWSMAARPARSILGCR
jgi:hypothetical protein